MSNSSRIHHSGLECEKWTKLYHSQYIEGSNGNFMKTTEFSLESETNILSVNISLCYVLKLSNKNNK